MWKWSGILLAGSFLVASSAQGQERLLSLALAKADGPREILGVVPDISRTPASAPHVDSAERVSISPPASLAFNSPLELFGSITRYGSPIDPYLCDLRSLPPTQLSDIVEKLRLATKSGMGPFDALGNIFDVQDSERPWSTTTSVRLQAKTDEGLNRWVPFASVAREVAAVEDRERLGAGGGMAYHVTTDSAFFTEVLYFGDRMNSGNAWDRETRFTLGFQFSF